jgi:energy-converting hydrogenase B subunit G
MSLYDIIINKIKQIQDYDKEGEPVTSIAASSTLAAEITLLSSILVAVIMLRYFSNALMIIAVLLVTAIAVFAMPIMPKLRKEQNDSLNSMVFYVILALGIITTLFYWGSLNV